LPRHANRTGTPLAVSLRELTILTIAIKLKEEVVGGVDQLPTVEFAFLQNKMAVPRSRIHVQIRCGMPKIVCTPEVTTPTIAAELLMVTVDGVAIPPLPACVCLKITLPMIPWVKTGVTQIGITRTACTEEVPDKITVSVLVVVGVLAQKFVCQIVTENASK